jgi:O-acetyl-ADP-ribose deacetylase (regulator of RNase III)
MVPMALESKLDGNHPPAVPVVRRAAGYPFLITQGQSFIGVFPACTPIWQGGGAGEAGLLADCYRHSLALADEYGLRSVAFPAISTGVYGYPMDAATEIAVREARRFIADGGDVGRLVFCCFSVQDLAVYQRFLA